MMTLNEELVYRLSEYERQIVADGLSIITTNRIGSSCEDLIEVLGEMSEKYDGWGLVSVMDYVRNNY